MTGVFMLQQTMALSVVASEISGFNQTSGVFNIDPTKVDGATGFRHYEKFNLSQGDIANLNFADINTFVNLVDNQINIDGIVNSVRGNSFYNGKAVFVSPNGMVVGASGVLNVGSLGVYAPDAYGYNQLKRNQTAAGFADLKDYDINTGGAIKINGKVVTAGDIELKASSVDIAKDAVVAGGVNADKMVKMDSQSMANALFNNLVNADNLNTANAFASDGNGHIIISAEGDGSGSPNNNGVNIAGTVKNFAVGTGSSLEIRNFDDAAKGLTVSGNVSNANGRVLINNNEKNLVISGTVNNGGSQTDIFNVPMQQKTDNSKLEISGQLNTNGLNIHNKGNQGMLISGTVNNTGKAYVENGYVNSNYDGTTGAMDITGTFNNSGDAEFINTSHGVGGMNVAGTVNIGGEGTFTNNGAGGLNVSETGNINMKTNPSTLTMTNTGNDGLNIAGKVNGNGAVNITNTESGVKGLNITGTVNNTGAPVSTFNPQSEHKTDVTINNAGRDGLNVSGKVETFGDSNVNLSNSVRTA